MEDPVLLPEADNTNKGTTFYNTDRVEWPPIKMTTPLGPTPMAPRSRDNTAPSSPRVRAPTSEGRPNPPKDDRGHSSVTEPQFH